MCPAKTPETPKVLRHHILGRRDIAFTSSVRLHSTTTPADAFATTHGVPAENEVSDRLPDENGEEDVAVVVHAE